MNGLGARTAEPGHLLPHAEFYGRRVRRRDVEGFALAHLAADPTAVVRCHTHETAHFILLLEGPYVTAARGAPEVCERPTLIYNPPGTTHRDRFRAAGGRVRGRFFSIAVAAERLRPIAEHVPLADHPLCLADPGSLALATRLADECRRWEPASSLVAEGICLELLARTVPRAARDDAAAPRWLAAARDLLRDRAAARLTIGAIARRVGVHPVHLARAFRRFYRCSPGDFLRRSRLERAAGLLAGSGRALVEVALDSGYSDQSQLSKAFRRAYGLSPSEYRRLAGRRRASR